MKRVTFVLCLLLLVFQVFGKEPTTKDSILSYINLTANSYRYGYLELNPLEQASFLEILEATVQFDANKQGSIEHYVPIPWDGTIKDLMVMNAKLLNDVPELWIMANFIPRTSSGSYVNRIVMVYTPQLYLQDLMRIDSAYQAIAKDISPLMSDYEKLLVLHDGFINWADYGNPSGANAGNIRGGLIEKRAICEGFARTFLYLCQRAGLHCMFIKGQNANGNHAWNYVQVEGKWYMIDVTADGAFPCMCGHDAFLRGQTYFAAHYNINSCGTSSTGEQIETNENLYYYKSLPTLENSDYVYTPTKSDAVLKNNEIDWNKPVYNLSGIPIDKDYKGVVVQQGQKKLLK